MTTASDLDSLAVLLSRQPLSSQFGVTDDLGASMDCLQTFQAKNNTNLQNNHFYGVYHSHNSTNDYWNIFLAESLSGPLGPWKRIQTLVTKTGSMPFIHYDSISQFYILAYEYMESTGNYPVLMFYSNLDALLTGKMTYETTLMKKIHTATNPNTYTNDVRTDIVNVGTPSITSTHYVDNMWIIYVRFHFTTKTAPEYDSPGFGVVTFKPSQEVNGIYFNWQAYFDNDVNNAIEVAREVQGGKIGQRANIRYHGQDYYLYEAQLNSNFDWHNWRLFLYSPKENRAVRMSLSIDGIVDFANPSVAQYPESTVITLFVPSEAMNPDTPSSDKPGCLIYTLPVLE
jgi:hypothetical protein